MLYIPSRNYCVQRNSSAVSVLFIIAANSTSILDIFISIFISYSIVRQVGLNIRAECRCNSGKHREEWRIIQVTYAFSLRPREFVLIH